LNNQASTNPKLLYNTTSAHPTDIHYYQENTVTFSDDPNNSLETSTEIEEETEQVDPPAMSLDELVDTLSAAGKEGFITRLEGYVAEQHVAASFEQAGHMVQVTEIQMLRDQLSGGGHGRRSAPFIKANRAQFREAERQ
jgi:hypothetical protein